MILYKEYVCRNSPGISLNGVGNMIEKLVMPSYIQLRIYFCDGYVIVETSDEFTEIKETEDGTA